MEWSLWLRRLAQPTHVNMSFNGKLNISIPSCLLTEIINYIIYTSLIFGKNIALTNRSVQSLPITSIQPWANTPKNLVIDIIILLRYNQKISWVINET